MRQKGRGRRNLALKEERRNVKEDVGTREGSKIEREEG